MKPPNLKLRSKSREVVAETRGREGRGEREVTVEKKVEEVLLITEIIGIAVAVAVVVVVVVVVL